jgi:hypothetical protein
MENTFDLKKFLVENKLTSNSKLLAEGKVEGIDLNLVQDLQSRPEVKKLQDQFRRNPELAKKAAKLVADIVDGKISSNLAEVSDEDLAREYGIDPSNKEMLDYIKRGETRMGVGSHAGFEKQTQPTPEKIEQVKPSALKQILSSAGLGSLAGLAVAPLLMAGTVGLGAAAAPFLLAAVLAGGLAGIGFGAAATDGFTRKSVVEEGSTDLAGEIQAIIDAGREM